MGDRHYALPDLRQLVAGRTHFRGATQAAEPLFVQGMNLAPQTHPHYDSFVVGHEVMLPSGLVKLGHDQYCTNATSIPTTAATTIASTTSGAAASLYGVEMESGWIGHDGGNNSRWPRQETLTLLEIRSKLDSRFKEANQKGPLWNEVSRIMAEEHGYHRNGKKCREKFENLYKYYKKTKEGKAGRQDGKHYRFFRQLEALYGDTSYPQASSGTHFVNNAALLCQTPGNTVNQENQEAFQENKHSTESLSFSNTSEFETSSSENNDDDLSVIACMMNRSMEKQKRISNESESYTGEKKRWKAKVKDFVDSQIRTLLDTQEAWMEKLLKTVEDKEHERRCREEEWIKQEMARFDREHEFWAKERAWMEARDAALMQALKELHTGKGQGLSSSIEQIATAAKSSHKNLESSAKKIQNDDSNNIMWSEPNILSLTQLKNIMEQRFEEGRYSGEEQWEEMAEKMASLGYDRSVKECKDKWDNMNTYFNATTECYKKRKEDLRTNDYFQQHESYDVHQDIIKQRPDHEFMSSPSNNSYAKTQMHDSCFEVPTNGGEWLWSKYGLKLSKEKNHHD